ncbi:hypothetical protein ACTI_66910 [Actinoplanes sp. OR16]|nr:hypothetical protein ACTI_66910 [Actinoplanes sp. OR16]
MTRTCPAIRKKRLNPPDCMQMAPGCAESSPSRRTSGTCRSTEAGHRPSDEVVPQSHRPGVEAEIDFGEVVINCMLFAFRTSAEVAR